ncbi:MAG: response regulator [Acidimicrobiales bacterium]
MRVILVDDAALLREGIASLLERAGHEVLAQRGDATDLAEVVARHRPDVVVIDIRMPPTNTTEGLEAAVALRAEYPTLGVLVLSQHIETRYALDLMATGAAGVGYLLKDRVADVDEFLDALDRVADGQTAIDPDVVTRVVQRERRNNPLDRLTGREREVLALMAEGHSNATIAARLVLNLRTIETHVGAIFTKLDLPPESEAHRRVQAVLTYLANAPA